MARQLRMDCAGISVRLVTLSLPCHIPTPGLALCLRGSSLPSWLSKGGAQRSGKFRLFLSPREAWLCQGAALRPGVLQEILAVSDWWHWEWRWAPSRDQDVLWALWDGSGAGARLKVSGEKPELKQVK